MKHHMLFLLVLVIACTQPKSAEKEIYKSNSEVQKPDSTLTVERGDTMSEIVNAPKENLKEEKAVLTKGEQKKEVVETSMEKPSPEKKEFKSAEKSQEATPSEEVVDARQQVPPAPPIVGADHSIWDGLLSRYVSASGQVNYTGLKGELSVLNQYLDNLKQYPPTETASPNSIMAYWINAYNAFTVKLILDNMPLSSIMKLDGGKVWDREWISLDGKTLSLNDIEHNILRKRFKDARIHFAVNCAAASCPPLHNEAWTSENLESTLNQKAKSFINNPRYNQISSTSAEVSKIFDWYASDFGDLVTYINRFSSVKVEKDAPVSFIDYDWSLNGK